MTDSDNVLTVKRIYEPSGDLPRVLQEILSDTARWEVLGTFPNGGTYVGPQQVTQGFFSPLLATHVREFVPHARVFHGFDDHVLVLGDYAGTSIAAGKRFLAPFMHLYTLHDGKITHFKQSTDTALIAKAFQGS